MPFTMEDFRRQFLEESFQRLSPEEQAGMLRKLPAEQRLAGLTEAQIREYLDRLAGPRTAPPRKPRKK